MKDTFPTNHPYLSISNVYLSLIVLPEHISSIFLREHAADPLVVLSPSAVACRHKQILHLSVLNVISCDDQFRLVWHCVVLLIMCWLATFDYFSGLLIKCLTGWLHEWVSVWLIDCSVTRATSSLDICQSIWRHTLGSGHSCVLCVTSDSSAALTWCSTCVFILARNHSHVQRAAGSSRSDASL